MTRGTTQSEQTLHMCHSWGPPASVTYGVCFKICYCSCFCYVIADTLRDNELEGCIHRLPQETHRCSPDPLAAELILIKVSLKKPVASVWTYKIFCYSEILVPIHQTTRRHTQYRISDAVCITKIKPRMQIITWYVQLRPQEDTPPVFLNFSTKYHERSDWRFGRFTPGEGVPGQHHYWIRGRVGPGACLDTPGQSKIFRRRLNQDFWE